MGETRYHQIDSALIDFEALYQGDRERDVELVKRRIEDEKTELQQTINR